MIKRLRRLGNSQALILEKPLLKSLGLKERGLVQLIINNGSLIVTPVPAAPDDDQRFEECLNQVMTNRKKLLNRLSKR